MKSLLRFFVVLTAIAALGCGSSSDFVATTPTGPGNTPVQTGTIVFQPQLAQAQTVFESSQIPAEVTDLRFRGLAGDQIVYGPVTYPKAATITLENVPVTIERLLVDLLNADGLIIGAGLIEVSVQSGATTTVTDRIASP